MNKHGFPQKSSSSFLVFLFTPPPPITSAPQRLVPWTFLYPTLVTYLQCHCVDEHRNIYALLCVQKPVPAGIAQALLPWI